MVLFAGSNAPDLFQEMVSASWCGVLASLSLLLEARSVLRSGFILYVVVHDREELGLEDKGNSQSNYRIYMYMYMYVNKH